MVAYNSDRLGNIQVMADSQTQQARFFAPEWWVRTYQFALDIAGAGVQQIKNDIVGHCLFPSLDSQELNFLGHVLGEFQQQILAGSNQKNLSEDRETVSGRTISLTVLPEVLIRHVGATGVAGRNVFFRLLQTIPGIRLSNSAGSALENRICPQPLFISEQWENHEGGPEAKLELAEMGTEAILGYCGSHSSFLSSIRADSSIVRYRNDSPPLVLWRSIWLELGAQEQAVLMRMEKAMQWDFRWLHLDGIFSEGLEELFRGIRLPNTKSSAGEATSDLGKKLRLLAKIGKKLLEHGWLAPARDPSYLAVADDFSKSGSSGPDLVWHVSEQRLNMTELQDYRNSVSRWLSKVRWPQCNNYWNLFLDHGLSGGGAGSARELSFWSDQPSRNVVLLGAAEILEIEALVSEWRIRQAVGSKLPLSEELAATEGAKICLEQSRSPQEVSESFSSWLADNQELVAVLRDSPLATIASKVSRHSTELELCIKAFHSKLNRLETGSSGHTSRISEPGSSLSTSIRSGSIPSMPATGSAATSAVQAQVMASRMRRVAAEELQRLKDGQPAQYRDLRTSFLQSLDEASRKVFAEVQARMEPRVFDEHLRQRLVKFMIDNPASWRSSSVGKGAVSENPTSPMGQGMPKNPSASAIARVPGKLPGQPGRPH